MMILDAHSDLFTEIMKRRQLGERDVFASYQKRLQQGQVEGCIFVVWIDSDTEKNPEQCALQMLKLIAEEGERERVSTWTELVEARKAARFYYLLGIEGLSPFKAEIETISWLAAQGVRHIGLTWNEANAFAAGALTPDTQGLTELGKAAVREIQNRQMVLDVSHLNRRSFWEVMELVTEPVIASHSNCAALCPVPRNLDDAQLAAIAATGGVIGVNSYPLFVSNLLEKQTLSGLADHVDYLVERVGLAHVALGFDFNYWDDNAEALVLPGLAHAGQAVSFLDTLSRRGYHETALKQIAHGNLLRVLREILPY